MVHHVVCNLLQDPDRLIKVEPSVDMKHSVVAVSYAKVQGHRLCTQSIHARVLMLPHHARRTRPLCLIPMWQASFMCKWSRCCCCCCTAPVHVHSVSSLRY